MNRESLAILSPKVATRREGSSRLLEKKGIWPTEVVDNNNGLVRFNDLLADGNGGVVFLTHPEKSDPFRVLNALMRHIKAVADRKMLIGVAQHQHMAPLNIAGKIEGVDTSHALVTPHTMERGKNYLHPSQKLSLAKDVFVSGIKAGAKFWDESTRKKFKTAKSSFGRRNKPLHQGWGLKNYRDAAIQLVREEKGVVGVAAQGGRSDTLGSPPPMNAVDLLLNKLNQPQDDSVAIAFVGVDPNPNNLPPHEDHLFSKELSRLSFNETLTRGELRERAKLEGISEAQFVFNMLGQVSREDYVSAPVTTLPH